MLLLLFLFVFLVIRNLLLVASILGIVHLGITIGLLLLGLVLFDIAKLREQPQGHASTHSVTARGAEVALLVVLIIFLLAVTILPIATVMDGSPGSGALPAGNTQLRRGQTVGIGIDPPDVLPRQTAPELDALGDVGGGEPIVGGGDEGRGGGG